MSTLDESATLRKMTMRLIPFLFTLYIVAYVDRVNVSFAKLQMNQALGFSEAVYGFGASIFFLGYIFLEVPSNLILERVGARWWIARIMVTWGIIAAATMFTKSAASFYALRFLLGAAEAGFFPGVILYLTYWFTGAERARIIALLMTATALSAVVGAPISGALLGLNHTLGLAGWKWLFLMEGLPAIVLGFVVLSYLPNSPKEARWLTPEERDWANRRLELERSLSNQHHSHSLRAAAFNPVLWLICIVYFTIALGGYGLGMFTPTLIKASGKWNDFQTSLLTMIPNAVAAIGMVLIAASSDRRSERRVHVFACGALAAVGFVLCTRLHTTAGLIFALSLAALGMAGMLGPFWSMPTSLLRGTAAAGGIALINSIGNIGGFVGPNIMGQLRARTGGFNVPLLVIGVTMAVGALVALAIPRAALDRGVAEAVTLAPEPVVVAVE